MVHSAKSAETAARMQTNMSARLAQQIEDNLRITNGNQAVYGLGPRVTRAKNRHTAVGLSHPPASPAFHGAMRVRSRKCSAVLSVLVKRRHEGAMGMWQREGGTEKQGQPAGAVEGVGWAAGSAARPRHACAGECSVGPAVEGW